MTDGALLQGPLLAPDDTQNIYRPTTLLFTPFALAYVAPLRSNVNMPSTCPLEGDVIDQLLSSRRPRQLSVPLPPPVALTAEVACPP